MDLSDWRDRIDALDRQLVALLNVRCEYARAVGDFKRTHRLATCDPERESTVLDNVVKVSQGPLAPEALRRIYERIMAEMRDVQDAERNRCVSNGQ